MSAIDPTPRSQNRRSLLRRYAWLLLLPGIAFLMRWSDSKEPAERLTQLSSERLLAVRNGQAYVLRAEGSEYIVEAQAIQGRGSREMARHSNRFLHHTVRGDNLYYLVPDTPRRGDCTLKIQPLAVGIPTGSGRSLELPGVSDYKVILSEDATYWTTPHWKQEKPEKTVGKAPRNLSPLYDIMELPLAGGTPRCLVKDMKNTYLYAGSTGIFWFVPITKKQYDLHFFRKGHLSIVPDYGGMGAPVEAGNRLYWIEKSEATNALIEYHNRYGGPPPQARGTLSSVNMEGTDRRSVEGVNLDEGTGQLTAYRDRFYLWQDSALKPFGQPAVTGGLWRLRKDGSQQLERIFTPPKGANNAFCFDGDYFYFVREEEQEGLFDLSGSASKRIYTLYRYRLPD